MKKSLFFLAFAAMILFSACGGGKPDIEDPEAVAKWMCDKSKELIELSAKPEENEKAMEKIQEEMEELEEDIEQHHKANEREFEDKVEEAFKKVCDVDLGF